MQCEVSFIHSLPHVHATKHGHARTCETVREPFVSLSFSFSLSLIRMHTRTTKHASTHGPTNKTIKSSYLFAQSPRGTHTYQLVHIRKHTRKHGRRDACRDTNVWAYIQEPTHRRTHVKTQHEQTKIYIRAREHTLHACRMITRVRALNTTLLLSPYVCS